MYVALFAFERDANAAAIFTIFSIPFLYAAYRGQWLASQNMPLAHIVTVLIPVVPANLAVYGIDSATPTNDSWGVLLFSALMMAATVIELAVIPLVATASFFLTKGLMRFRKPGK